MINRRQAMAMIGGGTVGLAGSVVAFQAVNQSAPAALDGLPTEDGVYWIKGECWEDWMAAGITVVDWGVEVVHRFPQPGHSYAEYRQAILVRPGADVRFVGPIHPPESKP